MLEAIWADAHSHIFDFLTAYLIKLLNQYNSQQHICSHGRYYTVRRPLRIHLQQVRYFIEFDTIQKSYRIACYITENMRRVKERMIDSTDEATYVKLSTDELVSRMDLI